MSRRNHKAKRTRQEANRTPRIQDRSWDVLQIGFGVPASRWLGLTLLACLAILSFLPSLGGQFIWDDEIITESQAANGLEGLRNIWSLNTAGEKEHRLEHLGTLWFLRNDNGRELHFWPITYMSFWIEDQLWGIGNTGAHHAVNLLLHAINSLIAWRLLAAIGVPGAFFAAALFAVHPVHAESVAWISGRKDLLAALFYMLSAGLWFRHRDADSTGHRTGLLLLSLSLYLLAMLSKTTAVTLPAVLFIVIWWKQGRITGRDMTGLAPLLAIGLAWGILDTLIAAPTTYKIDLGFEPIDRIVLMAKAFGIYASLAVLPFDLALLYPRWSVDGSSAVQWLPVLALALVSAMLWVLKHRIGRGWLAALAIYWVTLLPVLGLVDFGYLPYTFVADRYQYIALLVPAALLSAAATRGLDRCPRLLRRAGYAVGTAITAGFGVLAWNQSALFADEMTLFSHVAKHSPNAYPVQEILAKNFVNREEYALGLEAGLKAIESQPDYYNNQSIAAHFYVGAALQRLGRDAEAIPYLANADARQPGERSLAELLAVAYFREGRFEDAIRYFDELERLTGALHGLQFLYRATALSKTERHDRAMTDIDTALALASNDSELRQVRLAGARIALDAGDPEAALRHLGSAHALAPDTETYDLAAKAQVLLGNLDDAADSLRKLTEIDPGNPEYHAMLGNVLARDGEISAAIEQLTRALALDPLNRQLEERLAELRTEQWQHCPSETGDVDNALGAIPPSGDC